MQMRLIMSPAVLLGKDFDDQNPWVWERKFEIDSLCYPIQLAWLLWKNTGYTAHLDENFRERCPKDSGSFS